MNINNLAFFDRNGQSYNFSQDSNGVWTGTDYLQPISTSLYDVSNIFILENVAGTYKFPVMQPGSQLIAKWTTADSAENFFLFTIAREDQHTDSTTYIQRHDSITISYSDFGQLSGDLNLSYPLQLNVGFSPQEEISYSRNLQIYYVTNSSTVQVLSFDLYGEGEDEDERFRIWLSNFGIKFNREDALILKDYDLKESLPDWQQINSIRKQLLVNRDQIYPYVGTYKGLINLIDILGYRDVLRVKEYWRDVDPKSSYYNKFALVDITDLMSIGKLDAIDLVDLNGQIKRGGKFQKSEFLALAYEFSVASNRFDDDGMPEVEFTTNFEVDEIFYKMNRLATKLKTEILPVNVIIKDIIGEFIYFNKLNLRDWSDSTDVEALEVNDAYKLILNFPDTRAQSLLIRDIKTLYPKYQNTSSFPDQSFNLSGVRPYSNDQRYNITGLRGFASAIESYYENLKFFEFNHHGEVNQMFTGDDADGKLGCPVNLEAYLPDLTLRDLRGSVFSDFDDSHFTIGNLRYKNGFEIEWTVKGPQGYTFNWRGNLFELVKIPHILPTSGQYTIQSTVYDMQGGQNVSFINLTVLSEEPSFEVYTKIPDKNSYRFKDLNNVTLGDLADSPIYSPYVNVFQLSDNSSMLSTHYLDWVTYSNRFGVGEPQGDAEIWSDLTGYSKISSSTDPIAKLWGTGPTSNQPTLGEYRIAQIKELSLNRFCDLTYMPDRINGFILNLVDNPGNSIVAINFGSGDPLQDFSVASYSDVNDLVSQLRSSTNPEISNFNYVAINGNVHATAKLQNRSLNRILLVRDSAGTTRKVYTFCYPAGAYSPTLIDELNAKLSQIGIQIDDGLLLLNAPFSDILRKTGETCNSSDSIVVPTSFTTTVSFKLTKSTDFLTYPLIKAYSISHPTDWMIGSYNSASTANLLVLDVISSSGIANTRSDWAFSYVTLTSDTQSTFAAASDMSYWVDRGFVSFNELTPNFEMTGFLPSNLDHNSFDLTRLKIGPDGLRVPVFQPVFIAVSNINSKKQVIWDLYHSGERIVRIKSKSYFIWKFDEPGEYTISAEVTDANGSVYKTSSPVKIVHVSDINDYRNHVENQLNYRKSQM